MIITIIIIGVILFIASTYSTPAVEVASEPYVEPATIAPIPTGSGSKFEGILDLSSLSQPTELSFDDIAKAFNAGIPESWDTDIKFTPPAEKEPETVTTAAAPVQTAPASTFSVPDKILTPRTPRPGSVL